MKLNLLVMFGGRSVEHDVSIVTGIQAMENADPNRYEIIPLYIDREGAWYTGEPLWKTQTYANFDPQEEGIYSVNLPAIAGSVILIDEKKEKKKSVPVDAALICMHGTHGEDGALQGLLELYDIPYTSSSVASSAVGMDKALMKAVFQSCQFPMTPYLHFTRKRYENEKATILKEIQELGYPVYIKPASLGSSIGISKVDSDATLEEAIELAFQYDRKIVAEKGVKNPMEINCSVLGADGVSHVSPCEKPLGWQQFLTFEDKYLRGENKDGKSPSREIPADIPKQMTEKIQTMAKDAFEALDCKGVVRIDFLVDQDDGTVYINEINTIPGSLSFYLWEPAGIGYATLIDMLVRYAMESSDEKKKHNYAYDSTILEHVKDKVGTKGSGGVKSGRVSSGTKGR